MTCTTRTGPCTIAAGRWRQLGVDRDVVELMLGHSVGVLVGVYQHYDFAAERRAAFETWSSHVEALIG